MDQLITPGNRVNIALHKAMFRLMDQLIIPGKKRRALGPG